MVNFSQELASLKNSKRQIEAQKNKSKHYLNSFKIEYAYLQLYNEALKSPHLLYLI